MEKEEIEAMLNAVPTAESEPLDVIGIIIKYLEDNKYDGLCNGERECGCNIDDIAPCGEVGHVCNPAWLVRDFLGYDEYYTNDISNIKEKEDKDRAAQAGEDGI